MGPLDSQVLPVELLPTVLRDRVVLSPAEPSTGVLKLPKFSREGFVAETAIRLDRLQASVQRLEREAAGVKGALDELAEASDQIKRFRAFEETMRNAREYKIDELMRCTRELKSRVAQIEGDRTKLPALRYNSIERIDRKLSDLATLENALVASEYRVRLLSWVCGSTSAVLLISMAARYFGL
jgi:DNA repair exonuclease SbcCD ATPase subunit